MHALTKTYHPLANHMRLLALTVLFILPFLGQAQERTFGGIITDGKTEVPESGVEISIRNLETGTVLLTETKDGGKFQFKKAPIGKYELKVIDKDFNQKKFNFEVTKTHKPDLDFEVGRKVSWMWNWGDSGSEEHYWSHFVAKIVVFLYFGCLTLILFYSILQLSLAIAYVRNRKKKKAAIETEPKFDPATAPKVTVQLPMFNELYVADRIIETIAAFDYPRDKFQIQVLDDSTDETTELIAKKVAEVAATGINIQHIHRTDRTGYKAGALDDAMDQVEGEFIAIFDADFIPNPDWLQRTMPHFIDDTIGVVQTRWGHINKNYSILTELQAFGLNGHFAIEQGGRNASGHFINFNGTGGVWRKTCIEEAGGWEHDTLTEDLDLSYRAQLKGWKFRFLEHVIAPAELPITMSALKSQQHRWMKGGAECFIKMWKRISFTKGVRIGDRLHGLSHLFNSSVFIFILLLCLLTLPILHIKDSFADLNNMLQYGAVFLVSTLFLSFYYWHSYQDKEGNIVAAFFKFLFRFVMFLIVSMGLALNNSVAVIEGYLGIKSSFVRTPKFNVNKKSEFKGNKYDKKRLSILNLGEGFLFLLFGYTAVNRALYGDIGMVPFHLMLTLGYGLVFFYSIAEIRASNKTQ
ncbi:MAG: cellulose synthase/poly-beta-1,6-N-acetylglucosamine synthase-like glycosyltransferase [Flavobacteriaceae bacterium]|jgi:cellulose synthase/poly-beta-1,6-N-acetylglucosamine synthase-like glycosyltransferase